MPDYETGQGESQEPASSGASADDPTQTRAPAARSATPKRIGRFHVRRAIGTGGMGTVYEATQESPRRVVALKVMKRGIASQSAMRRFQYESQVLARLHHSGIAQVYEAGIHDDPGAPGEPVPYFAMEYIPGATPVTDYARERMPDMAEKLELFAKVCDAVHHGHQKGVIHRDLKPGNILVDSHGNPKIIDFGVARGTDSDMAVTTLQTDIGQLIGTLQYMSPEQCAADPHDIDVRSDVYALGVVLYELLSGKLPYDVRKKPVYESTRVIRDEQPTRLSTADRALRGDVETLVFKALEKDRQRRYQSALELAQDIRRYLAGEPISARPPSITYQLRIFARRHKALFTSAAAIFVVLIAGTIVSTALYLRAEQARSEALVERDRANAMSGFFQEVLGAVDPFTTDSRPTGVAATDVTVRDMLHAAARLVEERFSQRPELEPQVRVALAQALHNVGDFAGAREQAHEAVAASRRTWGDSHENTVETIVGCGNVLFVGGNRKELAILREAYEDLHRLRGPSHPTTLVASTGLAYGLKHLGEYAEAETLLLKVLAAPPEQLGTVSHAWLGTELAAAQRSLGKLEASEASARKAYEVATQWADPGSVVASYARMMIARAVVELGRPEEAMVHDRACLDGYLQHFGSDHPYTQFARVCLAQTLAEAGDLDAAERILRESLEITSNTTGPPRVLQMILRNRLAGLVNERGEFAESEEIARQVVAENLRTFGPDDTQILAALTQQGVAVLGQGRWTEAEPLLRRVVTTAERKFPDGYLRLPEFRRHFGRCLTALKRYSEAEEQLLAACEGELRMRGERHKNTRAAATDLVHLYESWGKPEKAAEWQAKLQLAQP